jgi:flagellar assembly protein FliH
MSSRILPPDASKQFGPVNWRTVGGAGEEALLMAAEMQRQFDARLAELEARFQKRLQETRAAAMKEGEATGRSQAATELKPVIERLARVIDELAQLRGRLRNEAEADLVKLSVMIARRVLRRELSADPDALRELVRASLEKLRLQELCRVRIHPAHAEQVLKALPQSHNGSSIEVIPDASCELGAVIFETTGGNLDASIAAQLEEIERGLAQRLRRIG